MKVSPGRGAREEGGGDEASAGGEGDRPREERQRVMVWEVRWTGPWRNTEDPRTYKGEGGAVGRGTEKGGEPGGAGVGVSQGEGEGGAIQGEDAAGTDRPATIHTRHSHTLTTGDRNYAHRGEEETNRHPGVDPTRATPPTNN